MVEPVERFSERRGYAPAPAEIAVRHDAPFELRGVLIDIAYESGFDPHTLRSVVCGTLRVREDQANWSAYPNVDGEVRGLLDSCEWFEVYDVVESVYAALLAWNARGRATDPVRFAAELNKYFFRRGIGWKLEEARIELRGDAEFERTIAASKSTLAASGRATASNEIAQALRDLSTRPAPDRTGAIQHALAALECVARDVTGDPRSTLGSILSRNPGLVPAPLGTRLEKIWGYASEQGRHLREGREPSEEEAELTVIVAAAVATYLVRKARLT